MGIVKDILYKISPKGAISYVRNQTVFPYYHLVRDNNVAHIKNLYPFKNVEQFKADLEFLQRNYKPISPTDLHKGIPENSFLLTFDDGLSEIYTDVFPILKAANIPAIFFLNPDFVDNEKSLYKHDISVAIHHMRQTDYGIEVKNKIADIISVTFTSDEKLYDDLKAIRFSESHKIQSVLDLLGIDIKSYVTMQKPYVTKAQIQEMIDAGYHFGGHTMSHPPLVQLSHEEQKAEISNSVSWLKANFGIDYSFFAFPFSDKGMSKRLLSELFAADEKLIIFGNSGLKEDFDSRIIQRFSLENPYKITPKLIVSENLYKYFNKIIGAYKIRRK